MQITEDVVDYVAGLARIRFNKDETLRYTHDLQNIIAYFDKLNELDTDDIKAESETFGHVNVFRDDETEACFSRDDILRNVPVHDDEYIIVPNIAD